MRACGQKINCIHVLQEVQKLKVLLRQATKEREDSLSSSSDSSAAKAPQKEKQLRQQVETLKQQLAVSMIYICYVQCLLFRQQLILPLQSHIDLKYKSWIEILY